MNVVCITPELEPLAKVGGMADVAASLSAALAGLGESVSVVMPLYGSIDRKRYPMSPTGKTVRVALRGSHHEAALFTLRRNGVELFLVENEEFFGREGIYGEAGVDYPDNAFRFAFLARAGLEAVRELDLKPDVLHIHDWPTALLPVYQKLFYRDDPAVGRVGVVLSLHNLAYQGVFPREVLPQIGLPWEIYHIEGLEYYDKINFLKGGLVFSEMLTTVSPTYALEIQTTELGAGLEGVLQRRAEAVVGILNGIDPSVWDPARDPALPAPYSVSDLGGKAIVKETLRRRMGLTSDAAAPLIGFVGRLDPQKGIELILESVPLLVAERVEIAVLGSGRREYVGELGRMQARFPGRFSFQEGFQDELARWIYAGSDLFLMPSRYEPCGLGQMIALRYGSIPVVRRTGGLADTVVDADADPVEGNGFVFDAFRPEALVAATRRAIARFEERAAWTELVLRGMRLDFSWKGSSRQYLEVYEQAIERARGRAR